MLRKIKEFPRRKKATPRKTTTGSSTKKTGKGRKGTPKYETLDISHDQVFEMVKQRAFELYCQRGYQPGGEESDWLTAEAQIYSELDIR